MIRRPFPSELNRALSSPRFSTSIRPLTLTTNSPFLSQVILNIFPFRKISLASSPKCADRRNAWQFRLHLELIDCGDFGSELQDDFSQFCGKSQADQQPVSYALKRFLLIPNDLIFDSSVLPGIPSLVAAPDGPDTRPQLSRRAHSMISLS